MLTIAASQTVQELAASRHIAALIRSADGYVNKNEHVRIGKNLRERLNRKAEAKGHKVFFALINRGHSYIFYFVGEEKSVVKKLKGLKEDC